MGEYWRQCEKDKHTGWFDDWSSVYAARGCLLDQILL